jgi:hypothetical protein
MNAINWKSEIVRLAMIKQSIANLDKKKALLWALPNLAACEDDLLAAERAVARRLPAGYREFLRFANGWRGFCVLTDLFGTKDLIEGKGAEARSRPDVVEFCKDNGLEQSGCLVVGDSPNDLNLFAMFSEWPETVVWICGEEVDRYNTFAEFFIAMIAYNEQVAARLANQAN